MEKCRYNENGHCLTHDRFFNPRYPGCAHWFDVTTLWLCEPDVLLKLLKEVPPAVVRDFCYQ